VVKGIWRYPVKSAQGERLAAARFGRDGPEGDRMWACVSADGSVVSAKNPRRWGRLLQVVATLVPAAAGSEVLLHVPGEAPVLAGTRRADEMLSAWLGEEVRLSAVVPPDARLQRLWPTEPGMLPEWAEGAVPGETAVDGITGARPGGRFVDFGAVHLVTTSELAGLRAEGVDADERRFRPNLVLDLEREPEVGDVLRVGPDLTLRLQLPTPRCAIPGAAQAGLERSPELLRALGRRRVDIPGLGRAPVLGSYAEVLTPGVVHVGDPAGLAA
jgi:uncharacterized protein